MGSSFSGFVHLFRDPIAFAPGDDPGPGRITLHSRGSSVALRNDINYRLITTPVCPLTILGPLGSIGASREGGSLFKKIGERNRIVHCKYLVFV